jgi:hypothetical protein
MKSTKQFLLGGMLAIAVAAVAPSAHAQKIYGQEGSADATMSIDGKQIPAPPLKFGGVRFKTDPRQHPAAILYEKAVGGFLSLFVGLLREKGGT